MSKRYKVDGMEVISNLWDKVEPSWYHVYLLGQILIVMNALMWSVGKPISFWVAAVAALWIIAVIQKI